MPKAKQSDSTALVVTHAAALTNKQQLATFQEKTAEQLGIISRTESLNVQRRVCVGIALLCIKASLKHGEWLPWFKKHAKGNSYRQAAYMMSIGQVFIDTCRVGKPDIAALPAGDFMLEAKDGPMRKLAIAAEKFAGDLTWSELLDEHGIKDKGQLGGARTAAAPRKGETPDPEQLYLAARDELAAAHQRARDLVVNENRLQHLIGHPEDLRGLEQAYRDLADCISTAVKPLLKKGGS